MTRTKTPKHIGIDDFEAALEKSYRLRGMRLPTAVDEVTAAEETLEQSPVELPAALRQPPILPAFESDTSGRVGYWTHPSIRQLGTEDPVAFITHKARDLVLSGIERGWSGPPYDPSALAELLNISLLPTENVVDARTRSEAGKYQIEFNPMRPAARLRFSIAHEIGHTLFPDCAYAIRNRATHEQMAGDEWQLEMLCNIAASEILMPVGSLPNIEDFVPGVDAVLGCRRRFQVSSEAVLLRLLRLTGARCFAFAAHRDVTTNRYGVDYVIRSRNYRGTIPVETGSVLPKDARAAECTAIGFTAKAEERWLGEQGWQTEYLGIAPYPGHVFPRVLAIVRPKTVEQTASIIRYLKGDAAEPRGTGKKILLQLVNDKAITWGAGFARSLRQKWPSAQREFSQWAMSGRRELKLGAVHVAAVRDDLLLVSLVAQKGYGETDRPRIRYSALEQCLASVADLAKRESLSVHMPRIGTGLAGGSWAVVEEIILQTLGAKSIDVTVYDLPNRKSPAKPQLSLFDVPSEFDQFV